MFALLAGLLLLGLVPFAAGVARLQPGKGFQAPPLASVLFCTLAFNLTFFWQELWLVIPKALTPGLHPTLFHNNHSWTGDSPLVDLLQGTGAVATLVSGLVFWVIAGRVGPAHAAWRQFLFWMAFQGLFQSLTQIFLGALLPANDVGRAFAWLGLRIAATSAVAIASVAAMIGIGAGLARLYPTDPGGGAWSRSTAIQVLAAGLATVLLLIPFRAPRHPIEVVWVPLFINLTGVGFLTLGAALARRDGPPSATERALWRAAGASLVLVLLFFHIVLRPGVSFG